VYAESLHRPIRLSHKRTDNNYFLRRREVRKFLPGIEMKPSNSWSVIKRTIGLARTHTHTQTEDFYPLAITNRPKYC
jgi:hypothetical protein